MPIVRELVRLSQAQIDAGGGQQDIDYMLDRPPYTRYWWTGEAFRSMGGGGATETTAATIAADASSGDLVTGAMYADENGTMYLATGPSTYVPLAFLVGTGQEPTIAAAKEMKVLFDAGSDIAHPEIYYTLNCYTGDPDTPDTALASERFNELNSEVVDLSMSGGSAGAIVIHVPLSGYITTLHFAFAGSGTYTVAAGNTVTALQMVVATWSSALLIRSVVIYFGESAVSGGSNQRIRKLSVVGFQ